MKVIHRGTKNGIFESPMPPLRTSSCHCKHRREQRQLMRRLNSCPLQQQSIISQFDSMELDNKRLRNRRRVRFESHDDETLRPRTKVHDICFTSELSLEQERERCWWSKAELKQNAKNDVRAYRDANSRTCSSSQTQQGTQTDKNEFSLAWKLCIENSRNHNFDIVEAVPLIPGQVPYRGLELCLFPELKRNRRYVISTFLKVQQKLPRQMSADQRDQALSAVSKKLTKPSKRIARLLGIGDANFVAEEIRTRKI